MLQCPYKIKVLRYWKPGFYDWLIDRCFFSRSWIFHSHRESSFPMRGRPKNNNNYLLFIGTLFQALKLSSKRYFTIWIICNPQAGWISLQDPLIFKSFISDLIMTTIVCPAERLHFIFVQSITHTYPVTPGIS